MFFIRFRLQALWWLYNPSNMKTSINTLNRFVEPFVERAIAERQKPSTEKSEDRSESQNFTEALSEFTADRKVLRDQLVNTLLAARDTTAAGLSWLFYELSYHPEKYDKLRNEVLSILGSTRTPTYAELKRMKYMHWCINEGIPLFFLIFI
jgi:cytochrome P450